MKSIGVDVSRNGKTEFILRHSLARKPISINAHRKSTPKAAISWGNKVIDKVNKKLEKERELSRT